jgi:2-oxoglutarate ferredoxin oxidoreductase subunit gamma
MKTKILLAGDGGQGIQTISKLITQVAFDNSFFVSEIPNFGLEQRGGVSLEFLQISDKEIIYPKFAQPDVMLIMSSQAKERTEQHQLKDTKILNVEDYTKILEENNISKQSYNIFFLGILGKILADKKILNLNALRKVLHKKLSQKPNWEENNTAFELGINL